MTCALGPVHMSKLLFKYMKRLTFESIKSDISNLSQPMNGEIELLEIVWNRDWSSLSMYTKKL